MNSENLKLQEQLEQERRDHELALRLAAENNSSVEDIQVSYLTVMSLLCHCYVTTVMSPVMSPQLCHCYVTVMSQFFYSFVTVWFL
jgi:hypothetical protein